jgi:hypothetical protein
MTREKNLRQSHLSDFKGFHLRGAFNELMNKKPEEFILPQRRDKTSLTPLSSYFFSEQAVVFTESQFFEEEMSGTGSVRPFAKETVF